MPERELSLEERGYVKMGGSGDVYIHGGLIGKHIKGFGKVDIFNEDLRVALETGLIDRDGKEIVQKEQKNKVVVDVPEKKGFKKEPGIDRSNAGNKPGSRGVNSSFVSWLENGSGKHNIEIEKGLTQNTINLLWDILLEETSDFFESDLDFSKKLEILEQENLISKNDDGDYEISEQTRRKLDYLKKIKQTKLSLRHKISVEDRQEITKPLQRIEEALKGMKKVNSYIIENGVDDLFEVKLILQDGSNISKNIEVKENTTSKDVRKIFLKLLKNS
ncbi:MAG: hypothetical protein WC025_02270 [Candidatus Magasanikbacteria bacterium]